jgi:hypothetical protein
MAKTAVLACGMAVVLLGAPARSDAFFCNWFGCGGCFGVNRTTYRPLFSGLGCCAAPACNPCATQTCNYVPQTCYRSQCVNVPVTTYRPVSSCDPCTGCPVTTLRPTTSFVQQVRYVPYTTYRPACTTGCAPAVATTVAAPVATTYYSTTIQANAAPASNCCTPAAATVPATTYSAPVTSYAPTTVAPATVVPSTVVPSTVTPAIPVTPAPTLNGTPAVPQSYDANRPGPSYQPLKPIPQNGDSGSATPGSSSSNSYPLLSDPHSRTTSLPQTPRLEAERSLVTPAVYVAPSKTEQTLDDSGWRAARR